MNSIIIEDDALSRKAIEGLVNKSTLVDLVGSFDNSITASEFMLSNKVDLIFLDVELPEMTGIELIKSLGPDRPQIILVTGNDKYAVDGFEFNITDFLLKPVQPQRFLKAVTRAHKQFNQGDSRERADDKIFVKSVSALVPISMKDIMYIQALADYVNIHTASKKYTVLSTMKAMEDKLNSKDFIRVHNSYIVRIDKISEVDGNVVIIDDNIIPISRSRKKKLLEKLKLL